MLTRNDNSSGSAAAASIAVLLAASGLIALAAGLYPVSEPFLRERISAGLLDGQAGLLADVFVRFRFACFVYSALALAAAALMFLFRSSFSAALVSLADSIRSLRSYASCYLSSIGISEYLAVAAITAAGAVLRLAFVGRPVNADEATTVVGYCLSPWYVAWANYAVPNNHILNTLLTKIAVFFGEMNPEVIRIPAFAAGVLCIPAGWLLGRLLYGRTAGLLMCALTAASSMLVEYSTSCRGYSLVCLFALLLAVSSLVIAGKRAEVVAAGMLAWTVCAVLGLFAIPVMLYPMAGSLVWMSLEKYARRDDRPVLPFMMRLGVMLVAALMIAAILYLPPVLARGPTVLLANQYVAPLEYSSWFAKMPADLSTTFLSWHRDYGTAAMCAAVVFAIIGMVMRSDSATAYPLFPVLLLVSILAAFCQHVVPYVRVWTWLLPFYLLCVAAGMSFLAGRMKWGLASSASVSLALFCVCSWQVLSCNSIAVSPHGGNYNDGKEVAGDLAAAADLKRDVIVSLPPSEAVLYYYFKQDGLSLDPFFRNPETAGRIWIILKHRDPDFDPDLQLFLKSRPWLNPTAVRLYRSYPSSDIYVIENNRII